MNVVLYVCIFSFHSIGADQLIKLIPGNSSIDLESKDTVFTVFAPADGAFDHLSLDSITYINKNLSYTEQMLVSLC